MPVESLVHAVEPLVHAVEPFFHSYDTIFHSHDAFLHSCDVLVDHGLILVEQAERAEYCGDGESRTPFQSPHLAHDGSQRLGIFQIAGGECG